MIKTITVALAFAVGAQTVFAQGAGRAQGTDLIASDVGIAIGEKAPGAAVQSLDGKSIDLAQYVGKGPTVLEFWATWCPLCKQLEPSLQMARTKYAGKVTFVSVGVKDNQTAAQQKTFATEKKISGEFVFDADGKAVAAFKAPHTSYLVVLDSTGKVVYTGVGGKQDIEAAISTAFVRR
jgi:thiol-disulfide isomerase/thioredoxin